MNWKHLVLSVPVVGQAAAMAYRTKLVTQHVGPALVHGTKWVVTSSEYTNLTYDIDTTNREYLIEFVSVVSGSKRDEIASFIHEVETDEELRTHIRDVTQGHVDGRFADTMPKFGRRVGWYAFARALKPRIIIETGVDKGLGTVLLASAILRNRKEGYEGEYIGTEIDPCSGYLLCGKYTDAGRIVYGDSISTLAELNVPIDLFINDSDHSSAYEGREYDIIERCLNGRAVVLGDNAHVTDQLLRFARRTGRKFLFFAEKPDNPHWYRGAGMGAAWK